MQVKEERIPKCEKCHQESKELMEFSDRKGTQLLCFKCVPIHLRKTFRNTENTKRVYRKGISLHTK